MAYTSAAAAAASVPVSATQISVDLSTFAAFVNAAIPRVPIFNGLWVMPADSKSGLLNDLYRCDDPRRSGIKVDGIFYPVGAGTGYPTEADFNKLLADKGLTARLGPVMDVLAAVYDQTVYGRTLQFFQKQFAITGQPTEERSLLPYSPGYVDRIILSIEGSGPPCIEMMSDISSIKRSIVLSKDKASYKTLPDILPVYASVRPILQIVLPTAAVGSTAATAEPSASSTPQTGLKLHEVILDGTDAPALVALIEGTISHEQFCDALKQRQALADALLPPHATGAALSAEEKRQILVSIPLQLFLETSETADFKPLSDALREVYGEEQIKKRGFLLDLIIDISAGATNDALHAKAVQYFDALYLATKATGAVRPPDGAAAAAAGGTRGDSHYPSASTGAAAGGGSGGGAAGAGAGAGAGGHRFSTSSGAVTYTPPRVGAEAATGGTGKTGPMSHLTRAGIEWTPEVRAFLDSVNPAKEIAVVKAALRSYSEGLSHNPLKRKLIAQILAEVLNAETLDQDFTTKWQTFLTKHEASIEKMREASSKTQTFNWLLQQTDTLIARLSTLHDALIDAALPKVPGFTVHSFVPPPSTRQTAKLFTPLNTKAVGDAGAGAGAGGGGAGGGGAGGSGAAGATTTPVRNIFASIFHRRTPPPTTPFTFVVELENDDSDKEGPHV